MDNIGIVIAVFMTVAIGSLGLALGAVAKQLENIAWQIERIKRTLDVHLENKEE